ncbi:MAG: M1 family metallopeptidase [Chryseolinea sp.]
MTNRTLLFLLLLMLFKQCKPVEKEQTTTMLTDPHSFSIPTDAQVTHLKWEASVNFDTKIIKATATWQIKTAPDADLLTLDTKGLKILKVTLNESQPAEFRLADPDSLLGQALAILIHPDTKQVNINYETSPDAEAVQWLKPSQTAGKKEPFLFTQSEAILARSWIPCQDSPGIKFTYEADITVPPNMLPLMSASNPQEKNDKGIYHFEMKQPISSYLLALAVGDIAFHPISARSGIYAEPSVLETAAWELADLEKMIAGAEALYGPYAWDRYDIIILPPSFPFGGMENPRLTFATPTILAGDRSLTSLVAHELAHSWSGNLVTNATWNDFWLNEGFTVYFENRIMEKLYGRDFAEMQATLAFQDLKANIIELTEAGHPEDTKLKLTLEGRNPDEGVTEIAYNKGYFFLRSIEEKFGRDKFDDFLKHYFSSNAFKAMTTDSFISTTKSYYKTQFNIDLDDNLFNKWIFTAGLPDDCPTPVSTKFKVIDKALKSWDTEGRIEPIIAKEWSTQEWLHFIKNLPEPLTLQQMTALDKFGKFTKSGNAEIVSAWMVLAIKNKYAVAYPRLEQFLVNTGRRKFLSPLYGEMMKTPEGKSMAIEIYKKARPNYHFVATNTFDQIIH